jgi:glutamate-1-semialdehyde 2,1-aminomutase
LGATDRQALEAAAIRLTPAEMRRYGAMRPRSAAAAAAPEGGFLGHVPLHWMRDWPVPFPMIVAAAKGARLTDVDGHQLVDFCLGDTGAMFGHAPSAIVAAMACAAETGFCHMLPSADAAAVGASLVARFGLPFWQVAATASDANRFALRVARAVTGRDKVLVFDGCYHGAVDEALVDLVDGRTIVRASVLGADRTNPPSAVAVPFNDVTALTAALASGEIACVMAEPAMTNCSMILPEPGFHDALRALTRRQGTLLLLDETHTISTGPGGYARAFGLEPDILVIGKPIAGGVPASVWGLTAELAARLATVRGESALGHSGIGTTLSGSAMQLACMRACLDELMTAENFAHMAATAAAIAGGIERVLGRLGLPWHVVRLGARLELVASPRPVRDAAEARGAALPAVERYLHLSLLNRGFLLTPFHNMILVSPATSAADGEGLVAAVDAVLATLVGAAISRSEE